MINPRKQPSCKAIAVCNSFIFPPQPKRGQGVCFGPWQYKGGQEAEAETAVRGH